MSLPRSLRDHPNPIAELRARGWVRDHMARWFHPLHGDRLTMVDAWERQVRADVKAAAECEVVR